MNKAFYIDPPTNTVFYWEELRIELNQTKVFNSWAEDADYFALIKKILVSLILDEKIVLTDPKITENIRTEFKSQFEEDELSEIPVNIQIESLGDLKRLLVKPKQKWTVTLFTSGTMGNPKKVVQTWDRLYKSVLVSNKHEDDIWGLAYNPAHIAGLQVIFQAVCNLNTIVKLFGVDSWKIQDYILRYSISHISATSAFYKQMLPIDQVLDSVRRITFGGEKIQLDLVEKMKIFMPQAKFLNIYASTESGTLLKSPNDIFTIDSCDREKFKIVDNFLHIHSSMVSPSVSCVGEWYNTGDRVEIVEQSPTLQFRFLSRGLDFINIGGYTVHLDEVKKAILALPHVQDARIYTKENSVLGNILLCDIATNDENLNEKDIRTQLQSSLVEYKIPRIFKFFRSLPLSPTGKALL